MGSFNVSCSMSNLSINAGDKALFFILIPNMRKSEIFKGMHHLEPESMLLHTNDYFNLFSFPIEGIYNDYGMIEDIIETENTKMIEHFFNAPISIILETILEKRSWYETFSPIRKHYFTNQNLFDYDAGCVDESFLSTLGFFKVNDVYKRERSNYGVKLIATTEAHLKDYELVNLETHEILNIRSTYVRSRREDFLSDFYSATNVMLNIREEDQKRIELLLVLSGMFVLKPVYEAFCKFDFWNKKYFEEEVDEFFDKVKKMKELKTGIDSLNETIQSKKMMDEDTSFEMKQIRNKEIEIRFSNPFDKYGGSDVVHLFGPHPFVSELLSENILNGAIEKEDFINLNTFSHAAYACNKAFMPSLSGEQCGNTEASLMLLNVSKEICDQRIDEED